MHGPTPLRVGFSPVRHEVVTMSAQRLPNTSKLSVTAEDFKDELDGVLEYVELASDRYDLPTLDDLFLEANSNRYWLLRYALRFAARCAYMRVARIKCEMAEERKTLPHVESFAETVFKELHDSGEDCGKPEDDDGIGKDAGTVSNR